MDIFLILYVLFMGFFPLAIFPCVLFFKLDPLYLPLKDMGVDFRLSNWLFFATRVLSLFGAVHFAETASFYIVSHVIFIHLIRNTFHCYGLELEGSRKVNLWMLYRYTDILFKMAQSLIETLASPIISVLFWLLILYFCVAVKGVGSVPFPVYFLISSLGVFILPIYFMWLSMFSRLEHESGNALFELTLKSRSKFQKAFVRSLRPIAVHYRPFSVIRRELVLSLWFTWSNQFLSTLLIF